MKKFTFLLAGALALTLAACGDEGATTDTNTSEEAGTEQVETAGNLSLIDDMGNKHDFEVAPATVATLDPGMMDILLELGANVVGRPTIHSDMADNVASIQDIGNPHEPSFEQIAALHPEVLIAPASFQQFASTVEATGTEIIYASSNSIDDIKATIEKYSKLFDNTAKADELIAEIEAKITEGTESSSLDALIVYGAPGTYLAALDNSLYGDILAKAGGNNIASNLPATDKYPSYANLSVEKIVEANPQVIMLITHSDPELVKDGFEKQMSENAAWKNLDAVKNGQILILPAELFDNPGTQVVEALGYMRDVLKTAEEAAK